jgi:hypothetical protein
MIFLALGAPSQFSAWGFEAFKRLVAAAEPSLPIRYVDRFDEVADDGGHGAMFGQFPSRSLSALLRTAPARMVLFHASPAICVRYLMEAHACGFIDALRSNSASAALIADALEAGQPLVVVQAPGAKAVALLDRIARHFGLTIERGKLEAIIADLGPPPSAAAAGLSEEEMAITEQVLGSAFAQLVDPDAELKVTWPYRVFLSGDRPNEAAGLVAEVVGASRVIYYGPYLHLKPGHWRARMTLGFSEDAKGLPFSVQAFGSRLLGEARVRPREAGIFAAEFVFEAGEPEHPIEFRIMNTEGAIEGRLALAQVELTPEPSPGRLAARDVGSPPGMKPSRGWRQASAGSTDD